MQQETAIIQNTECEGEKEQVMFRNHANMTEEQEVTSRGQQIQLPPEIMAFINAKGISPGEVKYFLQAMGTPKECTCGHDESEMPGSNQGNRNSEQMPAEKGMPGADKCGCSSSQGSHSQGSAMPNPGMQHPGMAQYAGHNPGMQYQGMPQYANPAQGMQHNPCRYGGHHINPGAGHPKHDQHQYGQIIDIINDVANGTPDVSKMVGFLEDCDTQFWKGAVIGAVVTLLFTSNTVKNAVFGTIGSAMDAFRKEKE